MDGKMKQWTSESCSSLKRCPNSGNVLIQSLKRFKLSTRHYGFRSASPGSKHVDADPNFSRGAGGTERGLCQDWWDESHAFPILLCFFTNMFLKISGSLAPCLPLMHGWCQQLGGFMHVMTWCYVQFLTLSFFFSFFKCLQINFHKDQQDQCWGQPLLNLLLSHSLF